MAVFCVSTSVNALVQLQLDTDLCEPDSYQALVMCDDCLFCCEVACAADANSDDNGDEL